MPNFASVIKAEILRLARKEVRAEAEGMRKALSQHRGEIAELKRRIASFEKLVTRSARKAPRNDAPLEAEAKATTIRFSAKGFASHRQRLGLSAAAAGTLVGVSGQTIYAWERGEVKPRSGQLKSIAAFRKMGKREVKAKLAQLGK